MVTLRVPLWHWHKPQQFNCSHTSDNMLKVISQRLLVDNQDQQKDSIMSISQVISHVYRENCLNCSHTSDNMLKVISQRLLVDDQDQQKDSIQSISSAVMSDVWCLMSDVWCLMPKELQMHPRRNRKLLSNQFNCSHTSNNMLKVFSQRLLVRWISRPTKGQCQSPVQWCLMADVWCQRNCSCIQDGTGSFFVIRPHHAKTGVSSVIVVECPKLLCFSDPGIPGVWSPGSECLSVSLFET